MVTFIGAGKIRPEKMDEVLQAIADFMPSVNAEEGTVEYTIFRGIDDADMLVFYEVYRDEEARQAHWATKEIETFSGILMSSVAGEPIMGRVEEIASIDR
jgi:quinol monooxygenase YgiN